MDVLRVTIILETLSLIALKSFWITNIEYKKTW